MRQLSINSLREVGIDFRFGHTFYPAPGISQALWFCLVSNAPHPPSDTYYWLEDESGKLSALVLSDLECQSEAIIPFLGGITDGACDEHSLTDRLRQNWLIPPSFHATLVKGALISPSQAFLWKVIRQQLSTTLCMPNVPLTLAKQIEALLEACRKEVAEKSHGAVTERYALSPHHEIYPSIEQLDEVSEFISMAEDFKGRLSEDIVALFDHYAPLLNARTHTIENYNTARSWTPTHRRNRIQAILSYPWLFHELGLRTGGPDYYHSPPQDFMDMRELIAEAIDRGQPLSRLMARRYNVGAHTLRYARTFLNYRYVIPEAIPTVLWFLDGIKPDLRPSSEADMAVLNNVFDGGVAGFRHEDDQGDVKIVASTLFENGIAGFRTLINKWCPSHIPDDPFYDVINFFADYAAQMGKGLITQEIHNILLKEWIRGAGLLSLLAASERAWWERRTKTVETRWMPLTTECQSFQGLIAHELSNSQALIEEGIAMHHCIASYASLCASGDAFIFSLRNIDDGKRLSTLHIGLSESRELTICEHRGFANRDPDQECLEAANELVLFLRLLRSERLGGGSPIPGVIQELEKQVA